MKYFTPNFYLEKMPYSEKIACKLKILRQITKLLHQINPFLANQKNLHKTLHSFT